MKRLIYIGAAMLLLAGCSSMLDDIRPKHAISSEAVNESDLGKLTNGVLYRMESLAVSFYNDGDYLGENFLLINLSIEQCNIMLLKVI